MRVWARAACRSCYAIWCADGRKPAFESVSDDVAARAAAGGGSADDQTRHSVWHIETPAERHARVAAEALSETDVANLKGELELAVAEATSRKRAAAQAEARRAALLSEAAHVSDGTADMIQAVVRESKTWVDEARRKAPGQSAHLEFMAQTMMACGNAALAQGATAAQRCQATEMARLCSEAMVGDAEGRARRARHRLAELEMKLRAARADDEYMRGEMEKHGSMEERLAAAQHAVDEQQRILDHAHGVIRHVCSHGVLDASVGSPPQDASPSRDDEEAAIHGRSGGRRPRRPRSGSAAGSPHARTHAYSPVSSSAQLTGFSSALTHDGAASASGGGRRSFASPVKLREADLRRAQLDEDLGEYGAEHPPLTATSRSSDEGGRSHRGHRSSKSSPHPPRHHEHRSPAKPSPARCIAPSPHRHAHLRTAPSPQQPPHRDHRRSQRAAPTPNQSSSSPRAVETGELETILEANLSVAVYDYNDVLLRVRDSTGQLLPAVGGDAAWLRLLVATDSTPLFMTLDDTPSDPRTLLQPAHRLWLYDTVGTSFAAFHLGGEKPHARLGDRPEISTYGVYGGGPITDVGHGYAVAPARPGEERTRHVRIIAPRTRRARHVALDEDEGAHSLFV